ncbi:DUF6194 family protein [Limnoglobus roseus]|uniref:DUF6194 domain-containing protein n=1 Tax=Limnoglobus roseus TaxID=2598579 RepID=A0A5C1AA66_9BACT|nr:DUF6194 family protein [Limnoglobus roseus]QEL15097.1 hypothetical protein PX52LOC_02005 [Limnoglobus roseus]
MDEVAITWQIQDTYPTVHTVVASGGTFFFVGEKGHRFPFATLLTSDEYDAFSNLTRPGVFRRNVSVSKETSQTLFATVIVALNYTALDRVMPPIIASIEIKDVTPKEVG